MLGAKLMRCRLPRDYISRAWLSLSLPLLVLGSCATADGQASNEGENAILIDGQVRVSNPGSARETDSSIGGWTEDSGNGVVRRVTDATDSNQGDSPGEAIRDADASLPLDSSTPLEGSVRTDARPDVVPEAPPPCIRDCSGKSCGDDKCGGTCGECPTDKVCNASQQCVWQELTKTETGTVRHDQEVYYGPYKAAARRVLIRTSGTGDVDLFVRDGIKPTPYRNDCASDHDESAETCTMNGPGDFYVLIYGWASTTSSYQLSITYTPAD